MNTWCRTPSGNTDHPPPSLSMTDARHETLERALASGSERREWSARFARRRPKPKHALPRRWSWDVLAYPDFRLYFAGSVVSNLGTWLQNTAQALLAYRLTHSVLAVGAVACAQFSSVLFLGPWAGTVVSRARNLQGLLIAAQLVSAAIA